MLSLNLLNPICWPSEDKQIDDRMDVVRMMLTGADDKTLGACFRAFRAAVYTLNTSPYTPHPTPYTLHLQPETRNPKPETRNPNPDPETRNQKPETRIPKPETRNPNPEARNPKPESRQVWKSRAAKEIEGKSSGALRAMLRVMNLAISKAFTTWRNQVRHKHPEPSTLNLES